jgi:hypothetical protein
MEQEQTVSLVRQMTPVVIWTAITVWYLARRRAKRCKLDIEQQATAAVSRSAAPAGSQNRQSDSQ